MARITVHALHADGEPRRWTLSERIDAGNLASEHYATQLLERLSWATADAEALESQTPDCGVATPRRQGPSSGSRQPGGIGSRRDASGPQEPFA
jgi:hypothetical protein